MKEREDVVVEANRLREALIADGWDSVPLSTITLLVIAEQLVKLNEHLDEISTSVRKSAAAVDYISDHLNEVGEKP